MVAALIFTLLIFLLVLWVRLSRLSKSIFCVDLCGKRIEYPASALFVGSVAETDKGLVGLKWNLILKFVIGALLIVFVSISTKKWICYLLSLIAVTLLVLAILLFRAKKAFINNLDACRGTALFKKEILKAHSTTLIFQVICFVGYNIAYFL